MEAKSVFLSLSPPSPWQIVQTSVLCMDIYLLVGEVYAQLF